MRDLSFKTGTEKKFFDYEVKKFARIEKIESIQKLIGIVLMDPEKLEKSEPLRKQVQNSIQVIELSTIQIGCIISDQKELLNPCEGLNILQSELDATNVLLRKFDKSTYPDEDLMEKLNNFVQIIKSAFFFREAVKPLVTGQKRA